MAFLNDAFSLMLWGSAVFIVLNLLAGILFVVYGSMKEDTPLKRKIHAVIYQIDKSKDHMEDPQKRAKAIMQIGQILAWRRIFIPSPIIGYVVDFEVYLLHKLGCPNLHESEVKAHESIP